MAKQKIASWADRRWKIFINEYNSNEDFRNKLTEIWMSKKPITTKWFGIETILADYGVPRQCLNGVIKFLQYPKLDKKEYLKQISHPIIYWSAENGQIGPEIRVSAEHFLDSKLKDRDIKVTKKGKPISSKELLEVISNGDVILQLSPYLTKTEIKELIDEYWNELEPLLKIKSKVNKGKYSEKLLGKIQPPIIRRVADRDALIMKLHDEDKLNDVQISNYLINKTNYTKLEPAYIRVIRSRNKNKTNK